MSYTYVILCTIGIFSLVMFPLYYNVVVNIIASATTVSVNEMETTNIPSTDVISADTVHLVELEPKI